MFLEFQVWFIQLFTLRRPNSRFELGIPFVFLLLPWAVELHEDPKVLGCPIIESTTAWPSRGEQANSSSQNGRMLDEITSEYFYEESSYLLYYRTAILAKVHCKEYSTLLSTFSISYYLCKTECISQRMFFFYRLYYCQ